MKSIISYLLLALLLWCVLPLSTGFDAQWHTFYWDAHYCREMLARDGGLWRLIQDFVLQFTERRWSAALLWAIPCWAVWLLLVSALRRVTRRMSQPSQPATVWQRYGIHLLCLLITAAGSWLALGGVFSRNSTNERFKAQMLMIADRDWPTLIAQSDGRRISNTLELTMRNLALAETGQLDRRLTEQPCRDINSLLVLELPSPYIVALVSDIYWSMGEISVSQMYAFEANEKFLNLSPRLLKQLVLTNIVFGQYEVARKYLRWLDKTLYHRQWAAHYRTLLSDEAVLADPILSVKRRCIPAENGFPSSQSIVYDLQQIVDHNPAHQSSQQYLNALNQLYVIQ